MLTSLPAGWRTIQSLLPSTRFFFSACSLTLLFSMITLTAWAQNNLYVTPDGAGSRNGSSWTNALSGTALQGALASAPSGTMVLVAGGMYKPTLTTDQNISFVVPNGVQLYGGYTAGTNTRTTNPSSTTLSGDIDNDNTLAGNTYHVVTTGSGSMLLDGLVITQGDARPLRQFVTAGGGGLFANSASISLRQVQFINNAATDGGGVFINRGSATLTNCVFKQNMTSDGDGGGLYILSGGTTSSLVNCSFTGNRASNGGGVFNYARTGISSPTLINCSFSNNSATSRGGAMYNTSLGYASNASLINSIIWGNTASVGAGVFTDFGASTTYSYTDSQDGVQPGDGNLSVDPLFADAANGDLRLTACSPAIDAGNDASNSTTTDVLDKARKVRTIDMGAAEFQGTPTQPLAITQQPVSSSSVCAGSPVSVPFSVSGTSSFFQWYKDDRVVSGQTSATLTLSNTTTTNSGSYVVVVTGCNSVTSTPFSLTVNPYSLPTVSITGLAEAYCQDAPAITLAPLGNPRGGSFAIDGTTATVFNPAMLALGDRRVTYSYTDANGCTNGAAQTVSVKPTPTAPALVTQAGGSYPAGVSSLTISQNTGNVILTVSGCGGGSISWQGGNSTTLAVSTTNPGTQSFTAICTSNGCTSPTATATVTVVAPTLKVLSRDPDNGQLGNNTIKPYLLLQNAGTTPIPYSTITLRYWLTTENNIPLLFQKNYVAIGQGNLNLRYVALSPARQGATGYIEYSFNGGAGSLAPNGDSGPLEVQASKQDYSRFVQSDDYSYINNSAFTLNPRITAYQNGVIFYGTEPTGTGSGREAVEEAGSALSVKVLGNPVLGQAAEVEISGASGQMVQLKLTDLQGKMVHGQSIKEAASTDRVSLPLGNAQGILLLEVSTSTQRQQIKLLRP